MTVSLDTLRTDLTVESDDRVVQLHTEASPLLEASGNTESQVVLYTHNDNSADDASVVDRAAALEAAKHDVEDEHDHLGCLLLTKDTWVDSHQCC